MTVTTEARRFAMVVCGVLALTGAFAAPAASALDEHLADLAPFVGRTFKGEFTDAASGKKAVDVQVWEVTLGGKAIRVTHSLNQGEYGGETIIFWDGKLEKVAFYYFTTAGFYTHGTMQLEGDVFTALEVVEGDSSGITEVRSSSTLLDDGRLHTKSQYLQDGEWVPGHEIFYVEAPDAELVFK